MPDENSREISVEASSNTTPPASDAEKAWFAAGLRFRCTGCGACCTGTGGSVFVSEADLQRLAAFTGLTPGRFARRYTRIARGRRVLRNDGAGDCVFLSGKTCSVYDGRPTQCRTYPFWLRNISDADAWREAAAFCEGIDHASAPVVAAGEILALVQLDEANDRDDQARSST